MASQGPFEHLIAAGMDITENAHSPLFLQTI